MMTGFATISSAVTTIKAGAYDYIVKPFSPELLMERVNEILSR